MRTDPKIIQQTKDDQADAFRIACDPQRYRMTLKKIAFMAQIDYDSLCNYASGATEMPLSVLRRLCGVIPDEVLSLLMPGDHAIVRVPAHIDHDQLAEAMEMYLLTKNRAHHPESEAGREIGPNEDNDLRSKFAIVAGGRS